MLDCQTRRPHGMTARHFLAGYSTRTVIITMPYSDLGVIPGEIERIITVYAHTEESLQNRREAPTHKGAVQKRGQLNKAFQVPFP